MHRLAQNVYKYVLDHRMILPGEKVLVACSGGPDSVALLNILVEMREQLQCEIFVAHVNHSMRGTESDRDADFVSALSGKLNLKVSVARIRKGLATSENSARKLRYAKLNTIAIKFGCTKIATGHTQDDQAETVLFFALRGSGVAGLSGIHPVRENLIRPLLETDRKDVLRYLSDQKMFFVEDSSNSSPRFTRNRLRSIVPDLERAVPGCVKNLCRLSKRASQAAHVLNTLAADDLNSCSIKIGTRWEFDSAKMALLPEARRKWAVYQFLENIFPITRMVEQVHVDALDKAFFKAKGPVRIACGFEAVRKGGKLIVAKAGKRRG